MIGKVSFGTEKLNENLNTVMDAIVKAIAPGEASGELLNMYYNVDMLKVAAPDYVQKYLDGELSDSQVYGDLSEIIENSDNNFWICVKEQLSIS